MDTYLELLPPELINVISLYLDYTEISILEQEFGSRINYQLLLTENYPAFSKIIKILKEKDIKWRNYPYDMAYDLITLTEKYIRFEIDDMKIHPDINREMRYWEADIDIRTDDISKFFASVKDTYLMIGDMSNILSSYSILTDKKEKELKKYKLLFPNIKDGDTILDGAYNEHSPHNSLDMTIARFNEYKDDNSIDPLIELYMIFIYVLEHLDTLDQYKDKIIKINPNQPVKERQVGYNEQSLNIKIVYQHIIEFIRAQEKYQKK